MAKDNRAKISLDRETTKWLTALQANSKIPTLSLSQIVARALKLHRKKLEREIAGA